MIEMWLIYSTYNIGTEVNALMCSAANVYGKYVLTLTRYTWLDVKFKGTEQFHALLIGSKLQGPF
jgi:hypothetical protein